MNLGLSLTGRGQIGQAAGGVAQGMQGMANLYGGQANLYNQAAAQGWAGFGNAINSGLGMYGNMQMQQKYLDAVNNAGYGTAGSFAPGTQTGALGTNGAWASNAGYNWSQPPVTSDVNLGISGNTGLGQMGLSGYNPNSFSLGSLNTTPPAWE
jgi:hypothetical protein